MTKPSGMQHERDWPGSGDRYHGAVYDSGSIRMPLQVCQASPDRLRSKSFADGFMAEYK